MRAVMLLTLGLTLALPCAHAAAADAEDAQRAGQIQLQAKDAWDAGEVAEALRLAQRAISLDEGATTWLAQQIRVEALEAQGEFEQAMGHLRRYLRLEQLFPEHVAWGEEAKDRIGPKLDAELAARKGRKARLGVGAGTAIGGAVPLAVGAGWLVNYGIKTSGGADKEPYLGFVDGGVALVAVGAVMEGVGIALMASSAGKPKAVAAGRAPRPVLVMGPRIGGGLEIGLTGRW